MVGCVRPYELSGGEGWEGGGEEGRGVNSNCFCATMTILWHSHNDGDKPAEHWEKTTPISWHLLAWDRGETDRQTDRQGQTETDTQTHTQT